MESYQFGRQFDFIGDVETEEMILVDLEMNLSVWDMKM